jgi:hypothetical protein
MAKSRHIGKGVVGRLRSKLDGRRERRAARAHARGEAKREWEQSGKVGRSGAHEGYSSGSF